MNMAPFREDSLTHQPIRGGIVLPEPRQPVKAFSSRKVGGLSIFVVLPGVLALACVLASVKGVLYAAGASFLFVLPGLALGLALFGRENRRCPEWIIFGSALGIGLSSYTAIALGYLVGWSISLITIAILVLTAACALLAARFWNRPLLPTPRQWEKWEYVILAGMVLVLTAFVTIPFLNVGRLAPHGNAYAWLFGWDFLVRGEYTVAIAKGFPPVALPLAGNSLRMYLVGYALPAFIFSANGNTGSVHAILLLTSLGLDILLYACLYALIRLFFREKRTLISTIFVFLFGYSFYWIVSLFRFLLLRPGLPHEFQRIADQLQRVGNVSHVFNRILLIEPQAVLATCLFLLVLFTLEQARYEIKTHALALCLGITLGIIFGTDALWGLIAVLWFGVVQLIRLVSGGDQRTRTAGLLITAGVSCGIVCSSFFLLGMYQLSSGHEMLLKPYSWLFKFAPLYFPAEFGPLLLLGVWGFALQWKIGRSGVSTPLIILVVITLLQVAFIQISVLPQTRMADRILPLVLLVGVGYLFRNLYESGAQRRKLWPVWSIALLALPTFFTDIYFTSNVRDTSETRYVNPADREACDWLKEHVPETAIIQGEPEYLGYVGGHNDRQYLFISLIADFADRPQALGWQYVASELVPNGEQIVTRRMKDIQTMLSASDPKTILAIAQRYDISYIYVGPYEQFLHAALQTTLEKTPQGFQEVYSAHGVHIYRVLDGGPESPFRTRAAFDIGKSL